MGEESPDDRAPGPWDHVATRLQEWRRRADEPSFSEIALRISRQREEDGIAPAAARVGRTTVYDAFRLGRSRVNLALVREIARALGVEDAEVDELLNGPAPHDVPSSAPLAPATPAVAPFPAPAPTPTAEAAAPTYGWRGFLLLGVVCLALNLAGRECVDLLGLPIYLDMVGTALAAIVLGPWRGAAVGVSTNVLGYFLSGVASLPFALVNLVGALVWGYGVHRFGWGRTIVRFFALNLVVAVSCTLTAVPILHWGFDGSVGHQQDDLTGNLLALSEQYAVALGFSNLLTSVADKMISGFVALVGATWLGHSLAGLPATPPRFLAERRSPTPSGT